MSHLRAFYHNLITFLASLLLPSLRHVIEEELACYVHDSQAEVWSHTEELVALTKQALSQSIEKEVRQAGSQAEASLLSIQADLYLRIQREVTAQVDARIQVPEIITQDVLQPILRESYTLLDYSPPSPCLIGGRVHLHGLDKGDEVLIDYQVSDQDGIYLSYAKQKIRGPLDEQVYILQPIFVDRGLRVSFSATLGRGRKVSYTYYRWRQPGQPRDAAS